MSEQYRETIYWKEIIALLLILGVLFFGIAMRLAFEHPPDWRITFWLMLPMGILFVCLSIIFRKLDITVTDENVTVGFAYPKKIIPLSHIEEALTDKEAKPFVLGFGIRMTRFEKEWVLVYNVIFARTAVLKLNEGKARYFVFSTKNPEEIVKIINANINKANTDGQLDD